MLYESHPGKPLKKHLAEVAAAAKGYLDHPALRQTELLREAAYLVGLAHDLGKYTPFFQAHLKEGRNFNGLERHSFLSAVLAAWLALKRNEKLPEAPGREFLPLLTYLAVHRHHGHLRAPKALLPPLGDPDQAQGDLFFALRALNSQLEAMRKNRDWASEWEELGIEEAIEFVENPNLKELFGALDRLEYRLKRADEELGARLCLWGQLLFSALTDADKHSATQAPKPNRPAIPKDLVERFLLERYPSSQEEINRLRLEFQKAVRSEVEALDPQEIPGKTFALTAPTGLGKTLAALDVALRLRTKLQKIWAEDRPPRIVYALPFINIIEQNYQEFQEVLGSLWPKDFVPETALLRHHHLAEISYRTENEALPLEQALLLTDSWESEVIVTTFVQLFQTILGYQNRFLRKLHNLIGSIVILDEIQALPMEYWPLVRKVFEVLRRELGVVVLQMTATRPLIFPEAQELHPNPKVLFHRLNRTKLLVREELAFEDWLGEALKLFEEHGSLLIVVNTVGTAINAYIALREKLKDLQPFGFRAPEENAAWLVHLSTNIVPKQRIERVFALKEHLRRGGQALVVSTQVIEAGVDLDFPAVLRDLGPLDSVVQVAGRCNREARAHQAPVYLIPLQGGGCTKIYGAIHTHVARQLLGNLRTLEEKDFYSLVEQYFAEVQKRLSQEASRGLWQAYRELNYDALESEPTLSEFHLIDAPQQLPIFVALTEEEERWFLEEFCPAVLAEKDIQARRSAWLKHRKRFHDHLLRPFLARAASNPPPEVEGAPFLRRIPHNDLGRFYHEEWGFRWRKEDLEGAWIG